MTIKFSSKKRFTSLTLVLVLSAGFFLLKPSNTAAVVVPPTFVAALVQALPEIGTVLGKLFNSADKKAAKPTTAQTTAINQLKKESEDGKKQLATYSKREQVIWRIVTASSQTSRGVSDMMAVASDKPDLTDSDLAELNADLRFVKQGINSIVASKPEISLFGTDTLQSSAIEELLQNAPPLADNIAEDLKYSPSKKNPELLKLLHRHLQELDRIFRELDKATAAEIQMIADGLSAVSALPQPAPTDKNAIKLASEKDARAAFGDVSALDFQIQLSNQDFREALQKSKQQEEQF
jgi:hypothetical protein